MSQDFQVVRVRWRRDDQRVADSITVTRLVRRMRNLLEIDIGEVWVEGEISNLRRQASGHCYFTLKDEGAQISCVLFRGTASRAKAKPEDGMQARLFGEVSVYEARGQVQLVVKQLEDAGMGDLQARFEKLKRKLDSEGLFEPMIKKELPRFPRKVGLITSPTGAALQDMLNILSRRAPWVQPILYPVTVQGKGAEHGIAAAIRQLGEPSEHGFPEVDVIITGRGGGSMEDLWNFNEEVVARAIHSCPVPIVSAVGHEIDFTISDFAADVRAPTPSAAAELVVPDTTELRASVRQSAAALQRAMEGRLRHDAAILSSARRALLPRDTERALRDPTQELDRLREDLQIATDGHLEDLQIRVKEISALHAAHHPRRGMQQREERLDHTRALLERAGKSAIERSSEHLKNLAAMIRALGPESTFARGFSITQGKDGSIIRDSSDLQEGDVLETQFAKGKVLSKVTENKT